MSKHGRVSLVLLWQPLPYLASCIALEPRTSFFPPSSPASAHSELYAGRPVLALRRMCNVRFTARLQHPTSCCTCRSCFPVHAEIHAAAPLQPALQPHAEVLSRLFPHQRVALAWMVGRENGGALPPFWEERPAAAGRPAAFLNSLTNFVSPQRPEPLRWEPCEMRISCQELCRT